MSNKLICSECGGKYETNEMVILDKEKNMCYNCYDQLMAPEKYDGKDK